MHLFTVLVENQPGELARLSEILGQRGVNLEVERGVNLEVAGVTAGDPPGAAGRFGGVVFAACVDQPDGARPVLGEQVGADSSTQLP
jgi:hypothetical protein